MAVIYSKGNAQMNEYSKLKCWSMRSNIGLFGIRGGVPSVGWYKTASGRQQFCVLGVHWVGTNEVGCNGLTILIAMVAGLWIGTMGGNKRRNGIPYRMWSGEQNTQQFNINS
jgi:hypothetical protein